MQLEINPKMGTFSARVRYVYIVFDERAEPQRGSTLISTTFHFARSMVLLRLSHSRAQLQYNIV